MFVFTPEDLIKILLAIVIGGVIGLERETHNKAAGLRTITLITVGATLFTIMSTKFGDSRVASNIVTGVGFLGGGVILFSEGKLKGLTTAATVWAAAAMGMAIGNGQYILSIAVTLAVILVLILFARLDHWVDSIGRETRIYQISYEERVTKHQELDQLFRDSGMRIRSNKRVKKDGIFTSTWEAEGFIREHDALMDKLLSDKEIKELKL